MRNIRVVGIDVARGLAILGMFVAHLAMPMPGGWLADGRPSALFAMLAGTGLGFMTARAYRGGDVEVVALRAERGRILRRSAALYGAGAVLMLLGTPVVVILGSYAVMFALMIGFLRYRPGVLLGCAGAVMVLAPPVVAGLRLWVNGEPAAAYGPPVLFELATGYYPALAWIAYLLVGLAVVRLDLTRLAVQLRLLAAGAAAAVAGYGGGLLAMRVFAPAQGGFAAALLSPAPHTDSAPELLGNAGAGVAVIALALLATRAAPGRVLLGPIAATGRLSLSVYSAHIVYIAVLGSDAVWFPQSQAPLLWLVVVTLVAATGWTAWLGQGPLERLVAALAGPRPQRRSVPLTP
ncbi:DUF418 domain-containing protein [Pseudactinotalea sp. HY160]|uniref:DUF418 domain-containing protein n=1 Tax=Pseudactinotalea sp. HY160 TaxID=2654490 RepID=UPI00128B75BD|nr:DUF418 domain-containing protein [Pseudactinotalea sp. HY160]